MAVFHADVVGSLIAPPELADLQSYKPTRKVAPEELRAVQDQAIDEAIAMQERVGLEILTDGELRRTQFFDQWVTGVDGLGPGTGGRATFHGDDGREVSFEIPVCVHDKLRLKRNLALEEFEYARSRTERSVKVTVPSPLLLQTVWNDDVSRAAYADPFAMFAVGADLVRRLIEELKEAGCDYVQVDAPELIQGFTDPEVIAERERQGVDPERFKAEAISYIDAALDVAGITRAVHLCRGNYAGMWSARGGYEELARHCFRQAANVDAWLMEYDDERSGGFEPLRDLPDDKVAVLGLVTTKRPELEDAERLRARIEEAARFHPLDRLAISTQCGFESGTNAPLDATQEEAKLRLVTATAQEVWDGVSTVAG